MSLRDFHSQIESRTYHVGSRWDYHYPIHAGLNIGQSGWGWRGTLGAIVTDVATGRPAVLTNSHVMGAKYIVPSMPEITNKIVHLPAMSTPSHTMATFARDTGHDDSNQYKGHYLDASVSIVNPTVQCSYDFPGVGLITGVTAPRKGMKLVGVGTQDKGTDRTAQGIFRVTIEDEAATFGKVPWGSFRVDGTKLVKQSVSNTLRNVISFGRPKGLIGGDSGTLFIEESSRKAVALYFGYIDQTGKQDQYNDLALACRADYVAERMGIDFTGKPGIWTGDGKPLQPPTTATKPTAITSTPEPVNVNTIPATPAAAPPKAPALINTQDKPTPHGVIIPGVTQIGHDIKIDPNTFLTGAPIVEGIDNFTLIVGGGGFLLLALLLGGGGSKGK